MEMAFQTTVRAMGLPAHVSQQLKTIYQPIVTWLDEQRIRLSRPILLGVSGPPGAGKSTFAQLLAKAMSLQTCRRVETISLDDFYLTKLERQQLARDVHPLCAVRGVPGTHDIEWLMSTLDRIFAPTSLDPTSLDLTSLDLTNCERLVIPRFDKLADDRAARDVSHGITTAPDCVLLEGWCLGCPPLPAWRAPYNGRESREDPQGVWARWSAQHLNSAYQALFERLDGLVMIDVASMDCVFEGRWRQEQRLEALRSNYSSDESPRMSKAEVYAFLALFERHIAHMRAHLPSTCDVLLRRGEDGELMPVRLSPL